MRHLMTATLLLLYVLVSISGLMLIKTTDALFSARFIIGAMLYVAGFFVWFVILKRLPLSTAFPLAAGTLIVGSQLAGWLILKEPASSRHILGISFVLAGVGLIFSQQ